MRRASTIEERRLLNPAFVAVILARATAGFFKESGGSLPYLLSFFVAPLVLHAETRARIPTIITTRLINWTERNGDLVAGLPRRVGDLADATRQGLLLAATTGMVSIADDGHAIGVIPEIDSDTTACPLCESTIEGPKPKLERLKEELEEVSERLGEIHGSNPRLQGRIAELERQLGEITSAIGMNQAKLNAVVEQKQAYRVEQENSVNRSRVQGRISAFLESRSAEDPELPMKLALVRSKIQGLENELSGEGYGDRLTNAESVLSEYMTSYARELELEHSDGRTRLDLRRLTVVAETSRHGSIRLENMGSGDNWVGCHVLTHVALHKFFRERALPVPAFLILDQPSKAHYPPSETQLDGKVEDDDRRAVVRLFKFILEKSAQGDFQAIVIDHADESEPWFQDAVVERWRGGAKLVPDDWPDTSE